MVLYGCVGSRTQKNLPTISVMHVLRLVMVVLVLEHGKPANHLCNVFPVVLYVCVGLERGKLPNILGMCFLWFSMVVLVLERGKPANHPWNVCVHRY